MKFIIYVMDEKELFAYNLTCLRKRKGKTQQEIADTFCYTFQAISRWETGKSIPDAITLKKIAEYYEVDLDFFFQEHKEFKLTEKEQQKIKNRMISEQVGLLLSIIFIVFGVAYFILSSIPALKITNFTIIATAFFIIALAFTYIFNIKKIRYILYSLIIWGIITGVYFIFKDKISNWDLLVIFGFFLQILIIIIQRYNKNK